MTIKVQDIVDALESLGGEAHLREIEKRLLERGRPPYPKEPQASIRARMQERCLAASAFKNHEILFESVYPLKKRKGRWRLSDTALKPSNPDNVLDGAEAFVKANEGRAILRVHLSRERSRKLINAFKASLVDPRCEACGMSFSEFYGELGGNYIEAHHKIPVSSLSGNGETKLSDLAALCANCHRMIHQNNLMPVQDLANYLLKRRGS